MKLTSLSLNHLEVFVAAVDDLWPANGMAFNTNTGRPELWLSVHLTTTNQNYYYYYTAAISVTLSLNKLLQDLHVESQLCEVVS